jgi:ribonuclease III
MAEERPALAREGGAVDLLEERLGLRLADRETALAALTHKSYVNEHREVARLVDNERLEFLGDAVIDLVVSHRLMERFPGAHEGELSKMRAAVVDEPGLCAMARTLDLGQLLRLGRGEELTGGRQKASLLADAMEAVVAAVFLESGLAPVMGIVDRFLGEAFARASAGTLDRDYKTQLQELAQSRFRSTPRYRVVAERGPDHSKTFEVEVDLRGEVMGRGMGRSKKDAEQAAAKLALEALARSPGAAGQPAEALAAAEAAIPQPASPGTEAQPPAEASREPAPAAGEAEAEAQAPAQPPARKARAPRAARKPARKPAKRKKAATARRPRPRPGRAPGGRPAARARPGARRGSGR